MPHMPCCAHVVPNCTDPTPTPLPPPVAGGGTGIGKGPRPVQATLPCHATAAKAPAAERGQDRGAGIDAGGALRTRTGQATRHARSEGTHAGRQMHGRCPGPGPATPHTKVWGKDEG